MRGPALVPEETTQDSDTPSHLGKAGISQALFVCIVSLRKSASLGFKVVSIILKKRDLKKTFYYRNFLTFKKEAE